MYIPGRLFTASSPSRTWIESAPYVLSACFAAELVAKERDPPHLMGEIAETVLAYVFDNFVNEVSHLKIVTHLVVFPNPQVSALAA
jgi:hypothetical protein